MKKPILCTLLALLATAPLAQAAETRCGWLQNPPPPTGGWTTVREPGRS
jgi:hypothetical protein